MKVLGNVEEMFCEANGIEGNIPMAGIAVNKSTAEKYPEKIALLQQIILRRGGLLRKNPETASRYFPSYFEKYIPAAIVEESLRRETLITSAAYELENELNLYLRAVHPGLFKEQNAPVMRDFLWRR
jgi:ABC-type nitrate/sulfonate/bicarbonate transport system substrate-binding protein